MTPFLYGRKVLVIMPGFHGYGGEICKALRAMGAEVSELDDRPGNSFFVKFAYRVNLPGVDFFFRRYYDHALRNLEGIPFSHVLLIAPEATPINFLDSLRQMAPNLTVLTYFWDSIRNKKRAKRLIPFADRCFSFDPVDCDLGLGLEFLPLFFSPQLDNSYHTNLSPEPNTVFAAASLHSDRATVIRRVKKELEKIGVSLSSFLFAGGRIFWMLRRLQMLMQIGINDVSISRKGMSLDKISEQMAKSFAILDIHHPHQTGLTMRTIETLGMECKLITTNPHVQAYDFYNRNNVLIIDRKKPIIPSDFFSTPFLKLRPEVKKKYSLTDWISTVFGISHFPPLREEISKPRSLLLVATTAWGGGAERIGLEMMQGLSEKGWRITFVSLTKYPDEWRIPNVTYICPSGQNNKYLRFFNYVLLVRSQISKGMTAVALTEGLPFLALWLANILKSARLVLWLHCVPHEYVKKINLNHRLIVWLSLVIANKIWLPSRCAWRSVIKYCGSWKQNAIGFVPNGMHYARLAESKITPTPFSSNRECYHLIGIGSLAPLKRWDWYLEVIALLKKQNVKVDASLFGEGKELEALKSLAHKLKIEDQIKFRGFVKNPFHELDGIILHPSSTESSPIVILESLAKGLPVIAYPIPAILELRHDGGALCVAEQETPDALANAVLFWINLSEDQKSIRLQRSIDWVHRYYSRDAMIRAIEKAMNRR